MSDADRLFEEISTDVHDWQTDASEDCVRAAIRAALSRARAEALEEAALKALAVAGTVGAERIAADIRALITTPAAATIPVERVREECLRMIDRGGPWAFAANAIARRLGVDLDAKGEDEAAIARGEHQQAYWTGAKGECPVCGEPEGKPHKMSCRPQNREDAERKARPANLTRCGCGDYAFSHRNNTGPCIINGCECPGFLAAAVTP